MRVVLVASLKEMLTELSELHAPTGFEDEVADYMEEKFKAFGWETRRDMLGNVIARKGKAGGKKVLVAAHMDEVGLVVTAITEKGFLKFAKVGGMYDGAVSNNRVYVHAKKKVLGVIGLKAPHLMKEEESKKLSEHDQLYIDVGVADKKAVEKMGIRPGTPVSFDAKVGEVSSDLLVGKAFDNRVGCAILLKLAEEMKNVDGEVYLVGTVREETGLFGAGVSAFGIQPDLAVALDTSTCGGSPDVSEEQVPVCLAKGPALAVVEGSGQGLIMSRKLVDWIESLALKNKVQLQFEVAEKGGTDASRMQYLRTGLLVASVGVPGRYMHSVNELVSLKDMEETKKLVKLMVESFKDYK